MKKLVVLLFALGCSPQKQVVNAPVAKGPSAGFKLALSLAPPDGMTPENIKGLHVAYTNTSNKIDRVGRCGAFGQIYHFAVIFNGVPVAESADDKKRRLLAQSGRCGFSSVPNRDIQPGQTRDDILYYDTTKPGTYQFTVDVDTDPLHPDKNFRVASNTVTVVVH